MYCYPPAAGAQDVVDCWTCYGADTVGFIYFSITFFVLKCVKSRHTCWWNKKEMDVTCSPPFYSKKKQQRASTIKKCLNRKKQPHIHKTWKYIIIMELLYTTTAHTTKSNDEKCNISDRMRMLCHHHHHSENYSKKYTYYPDNILLSVTYFFVGSCLHEQASGITIHPVRWWLLLLTFFCSLEAFFMIWIFLH